MKPTANRGGLLGPPRLTLYEPEAPMTHTAKALIEHMEALRDVHRGIDHGDNVYAIADTNARLQTWKTAIDIVTAAIRGIEDDYLEDALESGAVTRTLVAAGFHIDGDPTNENLGLALT